MSDVGTAWVSIAVSSRGIQRQLEREMGDAGRTSGEEFSREFGTSASSGRGIEEVANKALVFAGVAAGALGLVAKANSDLGESINAVEVRFGQFSDQAVTDIRDLASNSEEQFGLSERAFNEAAVAFSGFADDIAGDGGDVADVVGDIIGRATDFASVFNLDVDEALRIFRSSLAGQSEPLLNFGINLQEAAVQAHAVEEGIVDAGDEMTAQEKVLARYSLLMQETEFAAGDFARTSGGLANQTRTLRGIVEGVAADFGAPIVGFAEGLISAVSGSLQGLADFNEQTGGMFASGLAASIGIGVAVAAAVGVVGKIRGAVRAFRGLSLALQRTTLTAGLVGLALIAGFTAYGLLTQRSREVEARTNEVAAALDTATAEAFEYAAVSRAAGDDLDGFAIAQRAVSGALTETSEELTEALGVTGTQASEAAGVLLDLQQGGEVADEALRDLAEGAGLTADEADALIDGMRAMAEGDFDAALTTVADSLGISKDAAADFLEETRPISEAIGLIAQEADRAEFDNVAQQFLNQAVAASEDAEALVNQAEAQAGATRNSEDALSVYTALLDIVDDLPDAERDAALEALDLADAQSDVATESDAANTVMANTIELMSDAERQADELEQRVRDLTNALSDQVNPLIDEREAIRAWQEATEGIDKAIQDGTTSLSTLTEEGRTNQRMIEDAVVRILDWGSASLEAGRDIDLTTSGMEDMTDALVAQIRPFFDSERAARDYVEQLGLTPENIDTAVELAGDEAAKREIKDLQEELGEIPEELATEIEALIEEGKFQEARDRLAELSAAKTVRIGVDIVANSVSSLVRAVVPSFGFARGGFGDFGSGTAAVLHGREAILPLDDPIALRAVLDNDEVRDPLLDVLSLDDVGLNVTRTGRDGGDVVLQHYGQTVTPATVSAAMRMASFQR